MKLKTLKSIVLGEVFKNVVTTTTLIFTQVFFNSFGIGGAGFAATLYSIAVVGSHLFNIDRHLEFGPEAELDLKTHRTPNAYLVRTGIDLIIMLTGLLIWYLIGLMQGVEATFHGIKNPEQVVDHMAGNSWLGRFFLLCISHITLFSFARLWSNLYGAVHAYYMEMKEAERRRR